MVHGQSIRVAVGVADPADTVVQLSVLMEALFEGTSLLLEGFSLGRGLHRERSRPQRMARSEGHWAALHWADDCPRSLRSHMIYRIGSNRQRYLAWQGRVAT
jgi:hypothetical protein